jgi:COP9 signalosome complex subunit 4
MWIYKIKIESNRLLATLYKDERVRERPELKKDGVSAILEKMYLGTLVKREHVNLNLKKVI